MVSYTKGKAFENMMPWKLFGLISPIFLGGGFMYGKVSSTQKKTNICIGF
jgi:hypothetical protein